MAHPCRFAIDPALRKLKDGFRPSVTVSHDHARGALRVCPYRARDGPDHRGFGGADAS